MRQPIRRIAVHVIAAMNEVSCRGRSRLPEQAQNHGPPIFHGAWSTPGFTKADGGETGDGMLRRTPAPPAAAATWTRRAPTPR
ncbi:hypothetical protein [Streptosporangium vulgare]|uniref:Uncharacterized protein n=1 Tax=Streptosporangium vulgare TaxID=46190 RepID=A0ABV5TT37_9ACTN